jgi:cytochrome P450
VSDLATPLPPLAGTAPPPAKPVSFFEGLRAAKGNSFETVPLAAYEQPIYEQKSVFGRMLMISDPEGVRQVLVENVANYPKNEMSDRFFSAMFGEGLLSTDGAKWRTHRKVMAPSFDPRSVAAYAPAMAEAANAFADRWAGLNDHAPIDIAEEMKTLTLEIICRTMFSSDADELVAIAGDAFDRTHNALAFSVLDILPIIGPRRIKAKQDAIRADFSVMDAAIYRMIAAREGNPAGAPKDLLGRLIAAKDPDNGAGLSASEVRDEVITIFMAGHETTAVTMTWIWYLLSQRPDEEAKLHAELDAVLGGRAPTADDLPRLAYARMVVEEAMRLYPPAPAVSLRIARGADEICGVKVRRGDQIFVSPWLLHRHRRLWDDPVRFDPERFTPERSAGRPRFAYLPFGGGPRVCIGASLAMTEATLILAALAQRFRPRLAAGEDVKLQSRITLRPAGGMKMVLERRAVTATSH